MEVQEAPQPDFPFAVTSAADESSLPSSHASATAWDHQHHHSYTEESGNFQRNMVSPLATSMQDFPVSPSPPSSYNGRALPPDLTASVTSTPTTTAATTVLDHSIFSTTGDASSSLLLDTAASLLYPPDLSVQAEQPWGVSSTTTNTAGLPPMRSHGHAGPTTASSSSRTTTKDTNPADLSQLLEAAAMSATEPLMALPSLPETATTAVDYKNEHAIIPPTTSVLPPPLTMSSSGSFLSAREWGSSSEAGTGYYAPPPFVNSTTPYHDSPVSDDTTNHTSGQTIVPPANSYQTVPAPRSNGVPLAHWAGATARHTGHNSFRVEMEVHVSNSMVVSRRILQLWRNPTTLNRWCELIPSDATILTTHTHGTREESSPSSPSTADDNRLPYEGEWSKAIMAATLRLPCSSCWYSAQQAWLRTWGLAEYTTIRIFAEPVRQAVSIALSPLPGGMTLTQQLTVDQVSDQKVRLVNFVQLEATHSLPSMWASFWYPTTQDYREQTLNSMARLRFLAEEQL